MPKRLLLVVGMICLGTAAATAAWRAIDAPGQEVQVVEIAAERFSFTPSEIRTRVGVRLEIRLRSDDTDHGFRIIGADTETRIPKRGKGAVTVTFEPSKAGRYTFECTKLCGAGHDFMRGTIIVSH